MFFIRDFWQSFLMVFIEEWGRLDLNQRTPKRRDLQSNISEEQG